MTNTMVNTVVDVRDVDPDRRDLMQIDVVSVIEAFAVQCPAVQRALWLVLDGDPCRSQLLEAAASLERAASLESFRDQESV